ncbi:hypothetical protein MXB_4103 [Myxobolus squamalis]|nr:hypothetical protein MXB_4103 [Myxobolus squamalis]
MEIITSSICYELMETRSKMIVIDILMKPQQALNALLDVGERAALLFDSKTCNFEGMFTITDFLVILDLYYDRKVVCFCDQFKCTEEDINEKSIQSWRKIRYNTLIKDAIKLFVSRKVSCLPVVEETGRLINVYSKADIINLSLDKGYLNHDYKVSEALGCNQAGRTMLLTCKPTDTLQNIINKLATDVVSDAL